MQVTANNPIAIQLRRSGGCVITARLDYWIPTKSGWNLAGSSILQQVTSNIENQSITLPKNSYTVVAKFFVEESINGVYTFEFDINGQSICEKNGDVNTSASSHDSATFKTQFILQVN